MKRNLTLGVMALAMAFCSCASNKSTQGSSRPDLSARVTHAEPVEPSFNRATVAIMVSVDNHGSSPVRIDGAQVEVRIAGLPHDATAPAEPGGEGNAAPPSDEKHPPSEPEVEGAVFKGAMEPKEKSEVPPGGSAQLPVQVTLEYPEDPAAFLEFVKQTTMKLEVKGKLATSAGNVPINGDTDFPTPRLLEGKVKDAQMASIDEGAAGEINMDLVLHNPNPFPVKADKWNIAVMVDGKDLKSGDLAQSETIMANAGVSYTETFKIDAKNWGPGYKEVLKKKAIPYSVSGSISIGVLSYSANTQGNMQFHR
jgi:LEA14-like dessication related protein